MRRRRAGSVGLYTTFRSVNAGDLANLLVARGLAVPLLSTSPVGVSWQVDDHLPVRGLAPFRGGVDAFSDVSLHLRSHVLRSVPSHSRRAGTGMMIRCPSRRDGS